MTTEVHEVATDIFGQTEVRINGDSLAEQYDPTPHEYLEDPAGWVDGKLGEFTWSKQREIAESVVDNRYTAVHSCHDSGKSFIAARLAAWWLDVHPLGEAFVVTTAPTAPQVHAILWREIRRAHARGQLEGRTTLADQWYVPDPSGEDELVAYGRKPADYDQAAFQGIHARYVLVIMDEACGIPKGLYDAVDSLATNEAARVLAIGNPDDPASQFEKVCRPGSGWNVIHVPYDATPNFTDEEVPDRLAELMISETWVEERKKRWGEKSPTYISKVLGLFPDITDDTLITPQMIRLGQEVQLPGTERGQLGCDIARYGDDETAIYRDRGGQIRLEFGTHKQDTMKTAGVIAGLIKQRRRGVIPAQVDVGGLGAGVYDRLNELGLPAVPFGFGESPIDPKRFVNKRAEAYWNFREDLESGEIDLPEDGEDDDLIAQLGSVKYALDSKGRIKLESKEDMKKRGMPSPDRADAAVMAHWSGPHRQIKSVVQGNKQAKQRRSHTNDLLKKVM
jgi:hypothetical protein